MRLRRHDGELASHVRPVLAWVLAGTVAAFLVALAQDLQWFLPDAIRRRRIGMALVGFATVYTLARAWMNRGRADRPASELLPQVLRRVDALADAALSGGLTIVAAAVCLVFLLTWLPHYLLWPWGRDPDTFATLAQSWDAGIRPYRDIRGYNFPGAIYLFWVLGKLFGWGRTWTFYAFDALALVLLGVVLAAWSRRCLGRSLPGVAGYLIFLTFYLNRDFETAAQRDWHASLCMVLALLALQAWPGRTSRLIAALLAAAALAIRPHAVLFLPALMTAVAAGVMDVDALPGTRPGRIARILAAWFLTLAVFVALAFAPVLIAGIADDLIRGIREVAMGGAYNRASAITVRRVLAEEFQEPATLIVLGLLGLTLTTTRGAARRRAAAWTLAMAAALLYRPFHPVQHYYLIYPVMLIGSAALAPPLAWIIELVKVPAPVRVAVILLVLSEMNHGWPFFCDPAASSDAILSLMHGQTLPEWPPPGCADWFDPRYGRWYKWEEYRRILIYLRATTDPETLVANVLKQPPFPAINGPTGRLSPFLAESGICWMWLVDIDLEPGFAAALERATDCVVVWSPAEDNLMSQMRLERLTAVIRKYYRPEARFGKIEVWRRAGAPR